MADIKVIDFVPEKTLGAEQNARARHAHYQSEIARIEAIKLAHDANRAGVKND